jgi:hypothetical protein
MKKQKKKKSALDMIQLASLNADCVHESTLRQRHIQKMAEFRAIMKTL